MTCSILAILQKTNLVLMVQRMHQRKLATAMLTTTAGDAVSSRLGPLARLQSFLPIDDILRDQEVLAIRFLLVLRE